VVDRAFGLNVVNQIAQLPEGARPASGHSALISSTKRSAGLTSHCMFALVGNRARPSVEMGLECRPTLEAATSDRVLLDIAGLAFVLARYGASGCCEVPISNEGVQTFVESHLPIHRIMMLYEFLRIVDQHHRRDSAVP
jgi:hypothetical protein